MLFLTIFSQIVLSVAAWKSTPSLCLHSNFCLGGASRRSRRFTPVSKARAVFTTVTLAPPSANKLFAQAAEDSPLLPQPPTVRQPGEGPRRWRLFAGEGLRGGEVFRWTPLKILQAMTIFVLCGIAEIGGGWMVWKCVRENKPWWWGLVGSIVMVLYAFLPTLQPTDDFGRIYAVYGGFFIAMSYVWGRIFDGLKPDTGDVLGGCLALIAVLIIQYWPRQG